MSREASAISVKQPWANLIASGKKSIETRTWQTDYRGELLIISSKVPRIAPAGFALAFVRLTDCRPMMPADESMACCEYRRGAYSWVLEDVRRISPFPVQGRRGLFAVRLPKSVVASIESCGRDGA